MSTQPTSMLSEQTGHKYTFQLELKKLYITPSLPFEVKIVWARNQSRIQSQNLIKLQPPQNQITLQQCFCNKSTVLYNPKKMEFKKKQSRIQVILYANGSPKQGGQFVLNLCEIIDPYNIKKQQQKVYKVVTRQEKPRCQLQFKLTAEYYQQMIRDEQRSIGSGVGSMSSKHTTSLNQGTSSIGGLQQKQYVEKKNLFLYDAPSKDNQSVTSYNSYSTGMMRYNSGKKEREDSTKKEEYGLSTTTRRDNGGMVPGGDMFAKTTSVNIKSIGGDFDTRSKGGYNRVTLQQNFDNRTQNYDPHSGKQLQEEQSRRSKLQAEVSRLNIYMKEQSNKLTQYIQQNTKLKQQLNRVSCEQQNIKPTLQKQTSALRQQYEQQVSRMRQENDELHNRAFQLNNENRQLTRRYECTLEQKQKIEEQVRRVRTEKQRIEVRFQSLNRNVEGIVAVKQMSGKEIEGLKDELEHIKSLNVNLRDSLQKQRRKLEEIQYSNNCQKSTLEENTKKKQQLCSQLERENSTLIAQLKDRERQLETKKQLIYRLQKSSNQYKDKIIIAEGDKNRMLEQNGGLKLQAERLRRQLVSMKDSVAKVRDQKTAQYEQRNVQLQNSNYQNQQKIRSLQYDVEQSKKSYSQIYSLNEAMKKDLQDRKNQIYRLDVNLRALKQIQSKYYLAQKAQTQKQRQVLSAKQENNRLLYRVSELQDQYRKVGLELEETRRKSRNEPVVDVSQILRESMQMQIELKYKTDELLRLKGIQEREQELVYRVELEQKNRNQVEEQVERLQKQLKEKNKLYLIEVEKGKLIFREKSDVEKLADEMKLELKRCQEIIFNGDRQVKEMEAHIKFLEGENLEMRNRLASVEGEVDSLRGRLTDAAMSQGTVRQLERALSEKTQTVSLLTGDLTAAQKRVQQLQQILYCKQSEVEEARRTAQQSSQKLIEFQTTQSTLAQELNRSAQEKKSLELKCDTMLQELYSLKKQFEEEKIRSTSVVSIRSSEDQVRIRQMQNQLEKKDKMISKLTKEKLQIEQENINLHVQVMKKLSQMEKNKDLTPTQSQ